MEGIPGVMSGLPSLSVPSPRRRTILSRWSPARHNTNEHDHLRENAGSICVLDPAHETGRFPRLSLVSQFR